MKQVWKYIIQFNHTTSISMPVGATILMVANQRNVPCRWALVDPEADTEVRQFRIAGTGHDIEAGHAENYVGSMLAMDEGLVLHIFEIAL